MAQRYQIEYIEWVDSTEHSGGWREVPPDSYVDDIEMQSAGFVVSETERTVTITQAVSNYKSPNVQQTVNSPFVIPKSAILKRVKVGVRKR